MRKTPLAAGGLMLTLVLAACGAEVTPTPAGPGNGGVTAPPAQTTYTKTGAALLSRYSSVLGGKAQTLTVGSGVFNTASFKGAPPSLATSGIPDSCELGDPAPPDPIQTPKGRSLNAGPQLTLKSGAQTYASLPKKIAQDGAIMYGDGQTPLPTLPAQLSVQVPGAAGGFPAFTASFPPTPQKVQLSAPAPGATVTPDTTFRWSNPSNRADTTVLFSISQTSPDTSFSFLCFAKDDGSFSFSNEVKAALSGRGWRSGKILSTGYFAYAVALQKDAVMATGFYTSDFTPSTTGSVQSLSVRLDQTRALFGRAVRSKLGLFALP